MTGMSGAVARADIDTAPQHGSFLPGRLAVITCDAVCEGSTE